MNEERKKIFSSLMAMLYNNFPDLLITDEREARDFLIDHLLKTFFHFDYFNENLGKQPVHAGSFECRHCDVTSRLRVLDLHVSSSFAELLNVYGYAFNEDGDEYDISDRDCMYLVGPLTVLDIEPLDNEPLDVEPPDNLSNKFDFQLFSSYIKSEESLSDSDTSFKSVSGNIKSEVSSSDSDSFKSVSDKHQIDTLSVSDTVISDPSSLSDSNIFKSVSDNVKNDVSFYTVSDSTKALLRNNSDSTAVKCENEKDTNMVKLRPAGYPGFVVLERILTDRCKHGKRLLLSQDLREVMKVAVGLSASSLSNMFGDVDTVPYFVCQAGPLIHALMKDFLNRQRPSGWPSNKLIEQMMTDDFALVPKGYTEGDVTTFRVSFSSAEQLLAHEMNYVQRKSIILLKIIRQWCSEEVDRDVLKSYFFKTAVYYMCERIGASQWTENTITCRISDILKFMSECVESGTFPHYFIPGNNLILSDEHRLSLKTAIDGLYSGLHNYIVSALERHLKGNTRIGFVCPRDIESIFNRFVDGNLSYFDIERLFKDAYLLLAASLEMKRLKQFELSEFQSTFYENRLEMIDDYEDEKEYSILKKKALTESKIQAVLHPLSARLFVNSLLMTSDDDVKNIKLVEDFDPNLNSKVYYLEGSALFKNIDVEEMIDLYDADVGAFEYLQVWLMLHCPWRVKEFLVDERKASKEKWEQTKEWFKWKDRVNEYDRLQIDWLSGTLKDQCHLLPCGKVFMDGDFVYSCDNENLEDWCNGCFINSSYSNQYYSVELYDTKDTFTMCQCGAWKKENDQILLCKNHEILFDVLNWLKQDRLYYNLYQNWNDFECNDGEYFDSVPCGKPARYLCYDCQYQCQFECDMLHPAKPDDLEFNLLMVLCDLCFKSSTHQSHRYAQLAFTDHVCHCGICCHKSWVKYCCSLHGAVIELKELQKCNDDYEMMEISWADGQCRKMFTAGETIYVCHQCANASYSETDWISKEYSNLCEKCFRNGCHIDHKQYEIRQSTGQNEFCTSGNCFVWKERPRDDDSD